MVDLNAAASMAGWPTPKEGDHRPGHDSRAEDTGRGNLNDRAMLAPWPTPTAQMAGGTAEGFVERKRRAVARGVQMGTTLTDLGMVAQTAAWPTPKAEDAESTGFSAKRLEEGKTPDNLHSATKLLVPGTWATPNARDYRTPAHKSYRERGGGAKGENLNHQVAHAIPGASLNGLPASTGGAGLLSPHFSGWLQGYPIGWLDAVPPRGKK